MPADQIAGAIDDRLGEVELGVDLQAALDALPAGHRDLVVGWANGELRSVLAHECWVSSERVGVIRRQALASMRSRLAA